MEVSGKLTEAKHNLCENCQFENVTTNAIGICRDCSEYMCDACFRGHLKGRRNRNHELIDLNDPDITARKYTEEVEHCKQHDNEAIKFYCRKHEMVGCGDCMVLGHGSCKPEYIKDLSQNIQENQDFINLKRKIEQMEVENKSSNEHVEKSRKHCKRMQEEALAEISKFRTDINTYLDKAEAAIISEMEQLLSNNDKCLDQLENDCAMSTSKIEDLKKNLYTTVQRENVLFIQTVRSKASVQEIEHKLSQNAQSVSKVKRYEFIPNKQLASIIKSRGRFGQLNILSLDEPKLGEITTLENNVDTLTLMEPKKPLQQNRDIKAVTRPPPVVVGSRVKSNDQGLRTWNWYERQPGTVTTVHQDGTFDVKWDAIGVDVSGYTIGSGQTELNLI